MRRRWRTGTKRARLARVGGAWRPQVNTPPPAGHEPPGPDAGRVTRGWYLLGVSWRFLRYRPSLLAFPGLAAGLLTVAALAIFVPIAASSEGASWEHDLIVAGLVIAVPSTLISVFCNVAFVAMVQSVLRGESPTFRDGLRAAGARKGSILAWAAISLAVGAVLRLLAQLPGGELIGNILSWLGGLAWGLATFFVVPILVVEDVSARAAITRSAQTFRQRWGESLTGDITAGAALGVLMVPGFIVLMAGISAWGEPAALPLVAVALLLLIPLIALQSAVTQLFQLVVYLEATDGVVPAPFTAAQTAAVFRPRRRRFFGR